MFQMVSNKSPVFTQLSINYCLRSLWPQFLSIRAKALSLRDYCSINLSKISLIDSKINSFRTISSVHIRRHPTRGCSRHSPERDRRTHRYRNQLLLFWLASIGVKLFSSTLKVLTATSRRSRELFTRRWSRTTFRWRASRHGLTLSTMDTSKTRSPKLSNRLTTWLAVRLTLLVSSE